MAKATTTIKQQLNSKDAVGAYLVANHALFNKVAAFYFDVIQAHTGILDLTNKEAVPALEKLTHRTERNPNPIMALHDAVQEGIPAMFRRAGISAALGSARSFYGNLERYRWRKEKALAKAARKGKRASAFKDRPPVAPRTWNKSAVLYAGMHKERTNSSILIKVWTGACWVWVRVSLIGRNIPDGFDAGSPQLVRKGDTWSLHTPIEKKFQSSLSIKKQIETHPDFTVCAIDLNMDGTLAVCTIKDAKGSVLATKFIGDGQRANGFRKRLFNRIAKKRSQTGIIQEGVQDNAALWATIRNYDENLSHLVSTRIVQFALCHDASVLVFEHLGNLKPEHGKYSRRSNQKHAFWMKSRIFEYSKYKAYNVGILTSRVNPRDTSRTCYKCGFPVARYNEGENPEGYQMGAPLSRCTVCDRRDNSDRNASLEIGNKFFERHSIFLKEKPPTLPATERAEQSAGVVTLQDAKVPTVSQSTLWDGHESDNGHGTAQNEKPGLAGLVCDFHEPLLTQLGCVYDTLAQGTDYLGEVRSCGILIPAECH